MYVGGVLYRGLRQIQNIGLLPLEKRWEVGALVHQACKYDQCGRTEEYISAYFQLSVRILCAKLFRGFLDFLCTCVKWHRIRGGQSMSVFVLLVKPSSEYD